MPTPKTERLANAVSKAVERVCLEMLDSDRVGEIIVTVGHNETSVVFRPKDVVFREKIDRGSYSGIKRSQG
jgi:hypothetical protein